MGVKWGGVWSEGFYAEQGQLITDKGSLWLTLQAPESARARTPRASA
jgi:hypothetical protein